jgi:hypothetical protein
VGVGIGAQIMDNTQAIGNIVALFLSVLLLLFLIFALYRFLRLVWTRLPLRALSFEGADLDKLVAVVAALILVPSVPIFAWTTTQTLLAFIAERIRRIADLNFGPTVAPCTGDSTDCLVSHVTSFVGSTADGLVRSLNLGTFPVQDFVIFLLLAVVAVQIVRQLRIGLVTGGIVRWIQVANEWFPKASRERVVFAGFVLIAFYLGLSALLAIPLFQDKSRPQNLTVDALDKAMEPNVINVAEFDKIFPETLPPIRDIANPKISDQVDSNVSASITNFFLSSRSTLQKASAQLQDNWTSLRQSALNDQTSVREQVKSAFASGLEVGIGRKQTAQHYYDLFLWHQSVMQRLRNGLRNCQVRASTFNNQAAQTLDVTRTRLQTVVNSDDLKLALDDGRRQLDDSFPTFESALTACHPEVDAQREDMPRRNSFVASLGAVGSWSGWLLNTEQMPVVIIVGLVGFSLLGATVSRAVRTRQSDPNGSFTRLTLDDLVIVIAVGTTAAVVVFLAAYGGLAVLGGNTGDPNPYVLFATCLIGAVYSEDVWTWARTKGVSDNQQSTENGKTSQTKGADPQLTANATEPKNEAEPQRPAPLEK